MELPSTSMAVSVALVTLNGPSVVNKVALAATRTRVTHTHARASCVRGACPHARECGHKCFCSRETVHGQMAIYESIYLIYFI